MEQLTSYRVRQAKTKLELKNLYKKHKSGQPLEWRGEPDEGLKGARTNINCKYMSEERQ